jgi:outer membrane lipoprotein-sorting protein
MNSLKAEFLVSIIVLAGVVTLMPEAAGAQDAQTAKRQRATAPEARALLDKVKAKLAGVRSMAVDYELNGNPKQMFTRQGELFMERPNRYRMEAITGLTTERRDLRFLSDGQNVTSINDKFFIAYEKPIRRENFFLGVNFLVQFFFDPRPISFDPTDATWSRPISQFDTNRAAYDRDVDLMLLGAAQIEGRRYRVIEIKYNTRNNDVRQQLYIGDDDLIYQVDTYFETPWPRVIAQRYRNYRLNKDLPAATWKRVLPNKMPVSKTDPVRMGVEAPDFVLPSHKGGEFSLKEMLQGKKGMYICTFDGTAAKYGGGGADTHLTQMRKVQEMKDKFEKQGLMVVAIVGGAELTPDLKNEMMLNWLPDLTRFNYPILLQHLSELRSGRTQQPAARCQGARGVCVEELR